MDKCPICHGNGFVFDALSISKGTQNTKIKCMTCFGRGSVSTLELLLGIEKPYYCVDHENTSWFTLDSAYCKSCDRHFDSIALHYGLQIKDFPARIRVGCIADHATVCYNCGLPVSYFGHYDDPTKEDTPLDAHSR